MPVVVYATAADTTMMEPLVSINQWGGIVVDMFVTEFLQNIGLRCECQARDDLNAAVSCQHLITRAKPMVWTQITCCPTFHMLLLLLSNTNGRMTALAGGAPS